MSYMDPIDVPIHANRRLRHSGGYRTPRCFCVRTSYGPRSVTSVQFRVVFAVFSGVSIGLSIGFMVCVLEWWVVWCQFSFCVGCLKVRSRLRRLQPILGASGVQASRSNMGRRRSRQRERRHGSSGSSSSPRREQRKKRRGRRSLERSCAPSISPQLKRRHGSRSLERRLVEIDRTQRHIHLKQVALLIQNLWNKVHPVCCNGAE